MSQSWVLFSSQVLYLLSTTPAWRCARWVGRAGGVTPCWRGEALEVTPGPRQVDPGRLEAQDNPPDSQKVPVFHG